MRRGYFCGMAWWRENYCGTGFWFRVRGWGLHVSTKPRSAALFSERYGYRKASYVFGLRLELPKP